MDDGERIVVTEKAYGAVVVATARGLESAGLLNEEAVPNLERTIEHIAVWGETDNPAYSKVLKGYGKKLFGTRTAEERKHLRLARNVAYRDFARSISEDERNRRGDSLPEGDEKEDKGVAEVDKPWFGKAKAKDADLKDNSLRLPSVWKEYTESVLSPTTVLGC